MKFEWAEKYPKPSAPVPRKQGEAVPLFVLCTKLGRVLSELGDLWREPV